jgi:hypothetical protein
MDFFKPGSVSIKMVNPDGSLTDIDSLPDFLTNAAGESAPTCDCPPGRIMANVVEGEPRDSQEWFGSYLDEDGVVADVLKRVTADEVAIQRWLDPRSWGFPLHVSADRMKALPEHAGCLMFAGMSIRNFYGLWHADNPDTAFGTDDDVEITDGIVTDPRHPDNISGRIIDRVKMELAKLVEAKLA